MFPQNYS